MTNAAYLGALGLVAILTTAMMGLAGMPGLPCLFRSILGLPCPGCGMTRSMACVWHGDLVGSLRYHPLGPAVLAAIVAATIGCWAYVVVPSVRPRLHGVIACLRQPRFLWSLLATLLLVWALRLTDAFAGWGIFRW